jgi:NADH-quinone oxidoreductase subunit A
VLIFFGVLLVGFAYVWKRGDLEWVRTLSQQSRLAPSRIPVTGSVHRQQDSRVAT